jgi:hypothetical protein
MMRTFIGLLAAGVLLAGCASAPAKVAQNDNFVTMAGFKEIPRDSPAFATVVHMVPANRFSHRTTAGVTTYYYHDPTICGCVYAGTAENWASYKTLVADKMHMDANLFLERVDMPADTGSG